MALTIGHAGVRRRAVRLAHRFLGYGRDGELHPGVLQPSLVETAVSVAVQEGDARFFDAVLERLLASNDSALRRRLLVALGHATEPALATRARALSLDERLRSNEAMTTLQVQMASRETREATWQWITENFEMLTGRISSWRAGYMPTLASNFCDEPHARAVQAFFASQIEDLPGGPRNLATAVERIRLCAARVQAHRESVERYFTRHRR